MTPREQENLRRLALRAFAVEFCNAPVRKNETLREAARAIKKTVQPKRGA
jgi:hypothetical protein